MYYTPPPDYKNGARSQHRPYGRDVDLNLRKLIIESFDDTNNKDLNAVCTTIAEGALKALGFVPHDNTFMCAIVDIKTYDAVGEEIIAKM